MSNSPGKAARSIHANVIFLVLAIGLPLGALLVYDARQPSAMPGWLSRWHAGEVWKAWPAMQALRPPRRSA